MIRVAGGSPLRGEVLCGGSKNASLPLIASALAASSPSALSDLSGGRDVQIALEIARSLGAKVATEGVVTTIDPRTISTGMIPRALGSLIRPIYYFVPPLLNRLGAAFIPWPGGCSIGDRPIDLHLTYLKQFGVTVTDTAEGVYFQYDGTKRGTEVRLTLPFQSRGVTIGALLMSSFALGSDVYITNANFSAEALHTVAALQSHGASIERGPNRFRVRGRGGVQGERPVPLAVPADKIEAAFFETLSILTKGRIVVKNPPVQDLRVFHATLSAMGFVLDIDENGVVLNFPNSGDLRGIRVEAALDEDAFDADYEPFMFLLANMCDGVSTLSDAINPGRHGNFIPPLKRAGMLIDELTPTKAQVRGGAVLRPFAAEALDIRSGSVLLLAALSARGESTISGFEQIERGYDGIFEKLVGLGGAVSLHP